MSQSKRIASSSFALPIAAAAFAAVAASAPSAHAAAFLDVQLLGSTSGPGGPFSSTVSVSPGDTVNYQVRIQLGAEGVSNTSLNLTVVNWIPSNAATSPTSGLQSLLFSLTQSSAAGTIQTNFSTGVSGTSTGGGSWAPGVGSQVGTPTGRGNGNNDLRGVRLFRESGNYDGVAGTPVAGGQSDPSPAVLELLTIGTGAFSIASGGTSSQLNIDLTGFTAGQIISAMRWRDSTNTSGINLNLNANSQNNSATAGDPVIVFHPLALVPEPTAVGLLAAGLCVGSAGRRRRRA